ncbi:hypothetical protein RclHR1_04400002 [Rhizophagus clarus]|uniref:Uncharacterized protein n=1 Tax=Rhizophagus clarus TaxID=94130 RepID=A0A2Z6SBJ7_9GLOM|nr:hypothetical protein RclHR1_04400002 [Rhizophagus clarus]
MHSTVYLQPSKLARIRRNPLSSPQRAPKIIALNHPSAFTGLVETSKINSEVDTLIFSIHALFRGVYESQLISEQRIRIFMSGSGIPIALSTCPLF